MGVSRQITALEPQKRNPGRLNVYLDGEYAFSLDRLCATWLSLGQSLSPEQISKLQQKDEMETAYSRGLHFLSFRARSVREMKEYLQAKGYEASLISEVIVRLQEEGFLNDARFATDWIENRNLFRPRSPMLLRLELRQKGVSDELIQAALTANPINEEDLALKAGFKMAGRYSHLTEQIFRKRLYAALRRRGFGHEAALKVSKTLWNKKNDIE